MYDGLIHVSDFHATFFALAGGGPAALAALDGHDVWAALTSNASSPRTELLHNIDPVGLCPSKFPLPAGAVCDGVYGSRNAALRVGDYKLIMGYPGDWPSHQDGWVPVPGWTPPPAPVLDPSCGSCNFTRQQSINSPGAGVCLFNIREGEHTRGSPPPPQACRDGSQQRC